MLTHRRHNPDLTDGYVIQMCASDDNMGYGPYVWTIGEASIGPVTDDVIDFAADFYDIDRDEAARLLNPERIVDSAGAWDDPEFVTRYCDCAIDLPVGFRTPDGAVVFHLDAMIRVA